MFKTLLCWLAGSVVCWAEWSGIYEPSKLEAEKPRLQQALDFMTRVEITPFVPPQAAVSFGLQGVDLPLQGSRLSPIDFYSRGDRIVLPVETLLFVEDLARAYGWLWSNRYSTRTVGEYLSMLRYQASHDFPGGRYPRPIVALHVPDNALADPIVVTASVRLRRSAYAFMLLHQFGHVQLGHESKAGHSFSEAQEEAADLYALNIMKNNSATPTGVLLVMECSMYFEEGDSNALHPISSQRLRAVAEYMKGRVQEFVQGRADRATATDAIFSIASLLDEGAQWLAARGHTEHRRQTGLKINPANLQPQPLPKTTQ